MIWFHRLLAIAFALLANSCIDGREEVWIDRSGGGRAEIRYSFPAATFPLTDPESIGNVLAGFFERNADKFTHSRHHVRQRDGRIELEVDVGFASALDLARLDVSDPRIPGPVKHLVGTFEVERHGRLISFRRTIEAGKALPGWRLMPSARFKDRQLVQVVHLPALVETTNATRVENDGLTLVWETPLPQALREPLEMRFEAQVPVPWPVVAIVVIALVGVSAGLLTKVGRDRRARRVSASGRSSCAG
jgi:hypothetical protein